MPRRRDINDGQPPEPEGDPELGIDPLAGIIRPTMGNRLAHRPQRAGQLVSGTRGAGNETGQAAHRRSLARTPGLEAASGQMAIPISELRVRVQRWRTG